MAPDPSRSAVALGILAPLGERVVPGGAIGGLTTYRVGGCAEILVHAHGLSDLAVLSEALAASRMPCLVVGRGSNLLVADRGFPGIAVILDPQGFSGVDVEETSVRVGAAVALPTLARQTVEAGLAGFEWAVGVPGSVGGGVRMNAGGHGSDMASCLIACDLVRLGGPSLNTESRSLVDLRYGYRRSSIAPDEVVTAAELELSRGDRETGRRVIREVVRWRREHQPGGQNAGSVFTNPPGDSAGRVIEAAGLKGRRCGTATVSTKHANFIQADPGGSADDVRRLIKIVTAEVAEREGVHLETEVKMVGFPEPPLKDEAQLEGEGG